MVKTTKHYQFILFFNHKEGGRERLQTEKWRNDAWTYLVRLFENKASFACIARDENKSSLLLRGYVNLKSPCTQAYLKNMLGKYSACKPSYFGEMVSLCRLVHIDRDLTTVGRLSNGANPICKPFSGDPKFILKILLDSIDKKDYTGNGGGEDTSSGTSSSTAMGTVGGEVAQVSTTAGHQR